MALHHHQQVVEVVRDAAGEFADGLQLLRLAQLVRELFAIGDIQRHADDSENLAFGAAQRPHVRFENAVLPLQFVGERFSGKGAPVRRNGRMLRDRLSESIR